MKKITRILLAILGGIDVTISIFMPIIIAALWVSVAGLDNWSAYFFYALGLLSTLFRAIKVGWLK
jgi:hypothetical protein